MERKTLENNKESRDHAVLVGLRSPVLGEDSADEESLMELSELVDTAGGVWASVRSFWRRMRRRAAPAASIHTSASRASAPTPTTYGTSIGARVTSRQ